MPYKDREKLYKAQKRYRIRIRENLINFLSKNKCIDCGEKDSRVLEFDHVEPSSKFKYISKMRSGHYSWKSILSEINKCEIRCANCHRRKNYSQFGFLDKNKPL